MGQVKFSTEFDRKCGIVRHKVWGLHASPEDAHPAISDAMAVARAKNCRSVLFDFSDLKLQVSAVDVFNLTSDFEKIGLTPGTRCAVFVREMSLEHRLLEGIAVKRGFNLKLFDDQSSALQWLTSGH